VNAETGKEMLQEIHKHTKAKLRVDANEGWTNFQYDKGGNLSKAVNSVGKSVLLIYDRNGKITKMIDQEKNDEKSRRTLNFKYGSLGKPVEIEMENIGIINVAYDNYGEIIEKSNKLKIIQMKIGIIWQSAIGTYKEFTDLGQGHPSGLDILSSKRKIAIELKNRYNSDNASSRLSNYNKLAVFKKSNPEYTCIYAVINDNKPDGKHNIISHNNVKIEYYSGDKLLEFIFGDDKQKIINELQKIINTCI
jgi:hypothetical protein